MLCEKYRPKKLEDFFGHGEIIKRISEMIKSKDGIPHLMFYGPPGCGKTSLANALAATLFGDSVLADFYEFNASNDRGIDFIRNTIVDIAKRKSMQSPYKIILMDEADNITPDAQAAFRRIMEQYFDNCRFIFTCNYPGKLIAPILSRFVKFELPRQSEAVVFDVLKKISTKESIQKNDDQIKKIAQNSGGDFRKAINELEGNVTGKSDTIIDSITIDSLRKMTQEKRIEIAFQGDPESVFGKIWEQVQIEKAWALIPLLCDCQSKMNYSVHKSLFLANLLMNFK